MLPDRVSNPGPLTYESGALPIALRGPAELVLKGKTSASLSGAIYMYAVGVSSTNGNTTLLELNS